MYNYLKNEVGEAMPPRSIFVIAAILQPELAFTVTQEDFIDFLDKKGNAWTK